MNVRVLFFSVLQDITGTAETTVCLGEENPSVGALLDHLFKMWPGLSEWAPSILIAVDQVYARRPDALHENAEVAIMPPVQGG